MDNDPLQEWSRLENERTKHAVVSAAYVGMLSRSPQIDSFVSWLLAGSGATAGLLIANIGTVSSVLSEQGFQLCVSLLAVSAVFGLFAKCASVLFPIDGKGVSSVHEKVAEVFSVHGAERDKIEENARSCGLPVPPDIQVDDIVQEFLKPMPVWSRWIILLYLKKKYNDQQAGYSIPIRAYMWQANLCFLQALCFLAFIVTSVIFVGRV